MNPIADLKADGLRTLFIYIVPGAIALLPALCIFVHELDGSIGYAETHQTLAAAILIVLCLTVGKLMDGLGTIWEADFNDSRLSKQSDFAAFHDDWSWYIRTAFVNEPVAVGYIENLTQTLKFELNVGCAFAWFALCQIPLVFVLKNFSGCRATWTGLGALALAGFSFWSSYNTSRVLASVRKWLRQGVFVQGQI